MPIDGSSALLDVAPEVATAIAEGQAVVALESTIVCHGMPYPQNVETAQRIQSTIREAGAVPAMIAMLNGRLKAGLDNEQIDYLGREGPQITKASRRDIPFLTAFRQDGATTVAATMIIAALAGIRVFATGGIGGVHRGAERTMDVSADLLELARTDVAVVCAGVKSVLDIPKTLEYLETQGVPVIGFGTDTLPAFYTRSSGLPVDYRVDTAAEIAAALRMKWSMNLNGGMVVAVPVPAAHAMDPDEIDGIIAESIVDMNQQGIIGKETTPFLLNRIAERSGGRSLATNIELAVNNAQVAAAIAREYAKLNTDESHGEH